MQLCIPFLFLITSLFGTRFDIPQKIWQTYRTKELPRQAKEAQISWLELNPGYEYHLWDDDDIENYIRTARDADTLEFFKSMPIGVMKADLWRYLIIADQGGVYSDIDTVCCLPVDYWIILLGSLFKLEAGRPLLILGIENDDGRAVIDFCQWTFLATPKHPALEFACEYIVDNWRKNGIDLTRSDVVHLTTGPTILKRALMTYFGEPISTRASDFYVRYQEDPQLRQKLSDLGVYLLPKIFFNGLVSVHLVGSMNFGEGYIRWSDEVKALKK